MERCVAVAGSVKRAWLIVVCAAVVSGCSSQRGATGSTGEPAVTRSQVVAGLRRAGLAVKIASRTGVPSLKSVALVRAPKLHVSWFASAELPATRPGALPKVVVMVDQVASPDAATAYVTNTPPFFSSGAARLQASYGDFVFVAFGKPVRQVRKELSRLKATLATG